MKKISEFLAEHYSHGIYDSIKMAEEFQRETGREAPWHGYTTAGAVRGNDHRYTQLQPGMEDKLAIGGFEAAEACVTAWATQAPSFLELRRLEGRGSRFRMAIQCLEEVGL